MFGSTTGQANSIEKLYTPADNLYFLDTDLYCIYGTNVNEVLGRFACIL